MSNSTPPEPTAHSGVIEITPAEHGFQSSVEVPGSKSLTNRALLLAALADGVSQLSGVLFADDSQRMLDALVALGTELQIDQQERIVTLQGCKGVFPQRNATLSLGNAGTAMRFLSAACAIQPIGSTLTLDGIKRMRERPIAPLVDPLRQLGADITCLQNDGFPPLCIRGSSLQGGTLHLTPTLSSQYISALLQIAPLLEHGLELLFDGPVLSWPYVEMTMRLMRQWGINVEGDEQRICVQPGTYRAQPYQIEPDASSASYPLAAAALIPDSCVQIPHLGSDSLQGDAAFCHVLAKMGCQVTQTADHTTLHAPQNGILRGIDVNLNAMPDMAQTLAVVALFAEGPTVIRDVGNLRVKETDRLEALRCELSKLGAHVEIKNDDLHIIPPAKIQSAQICTYDDHRMAMAFSLAGLRTSGIRIEDPLCCSKTWPEYFDFMSQHCQMSYQAV